MHSILSALHRPGISAGYRFWDRTGPALNWKLMPGDRCAPLGSGIFRTADQGLLPPTLALSCGKRNRQQRHRNRGHRQQQGHRTRHHIDAGRAATLRSAAGLAVATGAIPLRLHPRAAQIA